jgi:hypothetical protein
VVAKVRDELFGTVRERLASLGRIDAMKPDAFSASLVHDGNRIAVRNTDDLAGEVFANDGELEADRQEQRNRAYQDCFLNVAHCYGWSIKGVSIVPLGLTKA